MRLNPELSVTLEKWQELRQEALDMMGRGERQLMNSRINRSVIKSIQVKTHTGSYEISLDGTTRPQLVLLEEDLRRFIHAYTEDPVHLAWERRLVDTIRQCWTRMAMSRHTDAKPWDLATFLSHLLEIAYAWRFYHASTDQWRLSLHKSYRPDTIDRYEGAKPKRDERHRPIKTRVKGKRTLDIGCGFGRIEEDLVRWGSEFVVALDISANFLAMMEDYARDRGFPLERVFRIQGDCRRLPFKKGSFDLAICVGSLFQIPHAEKAVGEVARLLDKGQEALLEFQARNPKAVLTPRYHFGMRQYVSEEETMTMLRSTGLQIQETYRLRDERQVHYLHSHLVTARHL